RRRLRTRLQFRSRSRSSETASLQSGPLLAGEIAMPSCWRCTLAGALLLVACLCGNKSLQAATQSTDALTSMRQDAELADVCFIDMQTGWAVGDRGVIWHTTDGGRTWRMQDSRVTARLESVCFLDAFDGWAVGGQSEPGTLQTSGI